VFEESGGALWLGPRLEDVEFVLARVRALVAEHPVDAVPVIEVGELRRVLGMGPS
jgi:hypothetical protein